MRFILCSLFLALVIPAHAQTILGKTVIDGKTVELFDDFTWDYVNRDSSCARIGRGVEFCGSSNIWKSTQPPNEDIAAMYRFDDRLYAMIVVEDLGSDDGLSIEFMKKTVIENAAMASGIQTSDVVILETVDSDLSDGKQTRISYYLVFEGLDIVYTNTIVNKANITVQKTTFEIGKTLTARHKKKHEEFIDLISID